MEKCLLVTIELKSEKDRWPRQDLIQELNDLVRTVNTQFAEQIFCVCDRPTPDLFIGKGKAEEIALLCQDADINTIIFSHDLSGTQQRNLEEIIGKKTIDRTQLILDIFSRHARSPEGKMQVELAQLEYLLPRLIGKGIILSRLGGGIGTRGPGEQKLEIDRRRIHKKITKLKQDLSRLTNHRRVMRKKRREEAIPCLALVGYTNAGKSTLLNVLTEAKQLVEDNLFTSLDPLTRHLDLPSAERVVISDTVGFLHHLPHNLIDAFHATLEEVIEADILIHVLDASHPRIQDHAKAVFAVLEQLHCENKPLITALNKIDLLQDKAWLSWLEERHLNPVSISAKTGQNLEKLVKKIEGFLLPQVTKVLLSVPLNQMAIVDLLYRQSRVKKIDYEAERIKIEVTITKSLLRNILKNKDITTIN